MENEKDCLNAELSLKVTGLDQNFYLYREQIGRHIAGISDTWYRPTYEAVYWSKTMFGTDGKPSFRSATKLVFESTASENEQPFRVSEILSAVPTNMLKYLVEVLNKEPAVVTFRNAGGETAFTINFDKSELWEQEKSESEAVYQAQEDNRDLSPYIFIRLGRAESIPGATSCNWDKQ